MSVVRFATPDQQHAGGAEHHEELQDICRRLRRFSVMSPPAGEPNAVADRTAGAGADRKRILDEVMASLRLIEEAATNGDVDDTDVDGAVHDGAEGFGIAPEPMDIDEAGPSCHVDFQENSGMRQMHTKGEKNQVESKGEMVVYDPSGEEEITTTTTAATEQNTVPEPKHGKGECKTCGTCQVLLETIQRLLQHQN
ncbi:hypothetical protein N3K66_007746 [Trichothecium roseum]|uniref:Uncharacterized protein n=1 Tax=Trichothecium roseum TaxID=47278 RepID=A0ACC0UUU1_9HYPO|nr:hypothetical protein N3K66_007746 [Trichothecium roseum]